MDTADSDELTTEILEFTQPTSNDKCLYLSNIPGDESNIHVLNHLRATFGQYGFIYEIRIKESNFTVKRRGDDEEFNSSFAFVTYYLASSAKKALKNLVGRFVINGKLIMIRQAHRKVPDQPMPLYFTRCYELANNMLGFNGWSVEIEKLNTVTQDIEDMSAQVTTYALVVLHLIKHGLQSYGYGVNVQTYKKGDIKGQIEAWTRSKKLSRDQAVVDAFQQVVLVVLSNGKVHAEVNNTLEDCLEKDGLMQKPGIIVVSNVPEAPTEESPKNLPSNDEQLLMDLMDENELCGSESLLFANDDM